MSTSSATEGLSGPRIVAALKRAGIGHVLSVPDISTSDGLLWPLSRDPDLRLVRVCKEDEAIGIATGLFATGARSAVLIQNTGLFYATNAIRVLAMEYRQPICLLVGLLLKEPERSPTESERYGVRLVPKLLDAMDLPYDVVDTSKDADRMAGTIDAAYRTPRAHAFLLGRVPTP